MMIIEELGLPHEVVALPLSDVKNPEYLAINPNGRVPTMHDPNTGIQIFESGAIVEYLCETYDKQHKLSFAKDTPEYWLAKQWLVLPSFWTGSVLRPGSMVPQISSRGCAKRKEEIHRRSSPCHWCP